MNRTPTLAALNQTTRDWHPERSEGSRGEILHCAQNDNSEQLHRKVYESSVVRFMEPMSYTCWSTGVWLNLELGMS